MKLPAVLTGFAGRLFLWFWLALSVLLVANFYLGLYLDDRQEPRALNDYEQKQLARLERALAKRRYDSLESLRHSRLGKSLILIPDNEAKLPERRRYWRLSPLLEAPEISALEFREGQVALGPIPIITESESLTAIWIMPSRPLPPWQQILQDSPHWRLLVSMLLVLVLSLILARWLSRPIRQLSRAARKLGDGDLHTRVAPGKGELGQLGRDFNEMADKLSRAMNNQQRLLADVSHELRSPLTRLKLSAGLLAEQNSNSYTERIEKECDTLEHLIEQLLTLARLEGSNHLESSEPMDIAPLIRSAIEDWRFQQPDRTIRYRGPESMVAMIQPRLFQRIMDNLLANATRYGQCIEITLASTHNHWQLTLEDDGPGVPQEQLDKLFEPFFRGDSARPHGGNIGLGLAIVQAAAHAQRLSITVALGVRGGLKFTLQPV